MIAASQPLTAVKAILEDAVRDGEPALLAECLAGAHLPALGGDQHPAEILHRALALPPFDPELSRALAGLTATLCAERAEALAQALERSEMAVAAAGTRTVTVAAPVTEDYLDDEIYVFNLCFFASYLPADQELFTALERFYRLGLRLGVLLDGSGRAGRQLRQALLFQQTDERMEAEWLGLLGQKRPWQLSAEDETDLLDAWTALLWIPPPPEDREEAKTLSIGRVERGLVALHGAVETSPEGLSLLRYAVRQLHDAYPRTPEFWRDEIGPRLGGWPDLLRDVVAERWPILQEGGEDTEVEMPAEARVVWDALTPERRAQVMASAAAGGPVAWKNLWTDLVLSLTAIEGLTMPQARQQLPGIRHAFESRFPALLEHRERPSLEELAEEEGGAAERQPARKRGINRLAALERVNKVVAEIAERLERRDFRRARRFLEDLIAHQEEMGTEPELIAKTLCNVAASVAEAGENGWAVNLYERAARLSPDDVFAHTGLAEVLKARDDLDGAEKLYRETLTRWPNNAVAHNGLAEVLKARDDLDGAEKLYRETLTRWPNDAVAHTGLAEVLKAREDLDGAEKLYRETLTRWPNDVFAHTGLAEVLKARDDLDGAEKLYRETLTRWPNNAVARNGLAEVLKARDDLDGAEKLYRETLTRWPNNAVARNGLANLLRRRQRFDGALALLPAPATIRSRQDLIDLHLHGMILLDAGDAKTAAAVFRRALEAARAPRQVTVCRSALALAELKQRRFAAARELLMETPVARPETDALYLHAVAGDGDEKEARQLHIRLSARILTFRRPVRDTVRRIETAYGLAAGRPFELASPDQEEDLIGAEIEMLLAA